MRSDTRVCFPKYHAVTNCVLMIEVFHTRRLQIRQNDETHNCVRRCADRSLYDITDHRSRARSVCASPHATHAHLKAEPRHRPRSTVVFIRQTVMDLEDKLALVTGGAQGLGRSFVEILLKNGAKVNIAYHFILFFNIDVSFFCL